MLVNNSSKIYNGTNEIVKVYAGSNVVYEKGDAPIPASYTELDYLQSAGNQYIDTGIIANSKITANIDFEFETAPGGWNALIGGGDGPSNYAFCNGVTYNGIKGGWITRGKPDNSKNFSGNNIMETNVKTNIQCLKISCIYTNKNGTFSYTLPNEYEFTSTHSIYLFAQNKSGRVDDRSSSLRMYYCKIYDDNVLVRDFVPVLDNNNVPCMYDKVSKACFYNIGTGSFSYKVKDVKVNYLESTGTQIINTQVNPTINHEVEIDYQFTEDGKALLFGSRQNWYSKGYMACADSGQIGNQYYLQFGDTYRKAGVVNMQRHTMYFNKNNTGDIYIDSTKLTSIRTSFTSYAPIYLFGDYDGESANPVVCGACKIYSCKIYDNGTLVRDLIPVLKEGTTPCLYDQLNNVYYENNGTGTFLYG